MATSEFVRDAHQRLFSLVAILAFAVTVSACGGGDGTSPPLQNDDPPPEDQFCSIPEERIFSGGVGRDGIPALRNPQLVTANDPEATYVRDFDRVIGIEAGGVFIAVPHNIGWWHEIVNFDDFGIPLAVSYCPLTGSSMVFDRRSVGGSDFGVSGLIYNNNLIMFNRRNEGTEESFFPQMLRGARCGPLDGAPLAMYPATEMRWRAWRELHPETLIVSGALGFGRNYRSYPYGNYEAINNAQTLFPNEEIDHRRPPKERLLGIPRDNGFGMAFPFTLLAAMGNKAVVHDDVQGTRSVVVFWSTEAESAVAFEPRANGQDLTFEVRDDKFFDVETGSEWTMAGKAISGSLVGSVLKPIPDAYVAFWFAWATFHPNTALL